jgi:hypothetical protein
VGKIAEKIEEQFIMVVTWEKLPALTPTLLLRNYATALAAGVFVVVGISGTMLFFHLAEGRVKEAHEWFGLLFVTAGVFHVVRNWKPFVHLVGLVRTQAVIGVVMATTLAFVVLSPAEGGNPMKRAAFALQQAPISAVAPALGLTLEQLTARLTAGGITVSDSSQSLAQIAADRNIPPPRLFALILGEAR